MNPDPKTVHIVVPFFDEEEVIPCLCSRLERVCRSIQDKVEVIFVDDGSRDRSCEMVRANGDLTVPWKLIRLARNFGQQAAYRAGLDYADGDAVIFMDADLQDPPEKIPELIQAWRAGAKVVVGVRESRKETGVRRWCFDLFHEIFFRLTHGMLPKDSGTFGLMDRVVADWVCGLREVNLFLPALRCWFGFPTSFVYYKRELRAAGEEKQSYWKLLNYAWDGVTSFSVAPLRLITVLGLVVAIPSFLYGGWLIVQRILQQFGYFKSLDVLGFTTIAVAVFFMGGLQLICLGIIGEYLAKMFSEMKGRPVFVVDEVVSSSSTDQK